jgi:hypothetical protein
MTTAEKKRKQLFEKIVKAYSKDEMSWKDLAKKFKVGFKTISEALGAAGIKRRRNVAAPRVQQRTTAIRADLVRSLVDNVIKAADGRPVQSIHINVTTGSVTISYVEHKELNFKE